MIPSAFTYKRAASADEALGLAAEHGEDAKFLAGGHSLLPLMKLRLAAPEVLIDLGGIARPVLRQRPGLLRRDRRADQAPRCRAFRRCSPMRVPLLAHAAGPGRRPADQAPRHDRRLDRARRPRLRPARRAARAGRDDRRARCRREQGDPDRGVLPGHVRDRARARRTAHRDPGAEARVRRPGRSRSSPSGRSTGPSSAAPCRTVTSPWSTWAGRRCARPGWRPRSPPARRPPRRPRYAAEGTSAADDIRATRAYREHLARVLVSRALTEANSRS